MRKSLKYIPLAEEASSKIAFSSEKGSVLFEFAGDEKTVTTEVYTALLEGSAEFKTCIEQKVIVATDVPEPVVEAAIEAQEKASTDTKEELTGNPRKASTTTK